MPGTPTRSGVVRPTSVERHLEAQFLRRAAELVEVGWCQRGLAQDHRGRQVEPWSRSACCWSPLGALLRVWFEGWGGEADVFDVAYEALALSTGGRVEEWNDARWRTRRHVLAAFTRARACLPVARRRVRERAERSRPEV